MPELLKKEKIRITIVTTDYKITGEIPTHEGYHGRLSDLLNEEKRFLNISDVEMQSRVDDKSIVSAKFLCLNKDAIILVHPVG
ncbi:MAG: hypothetical protein ABH873_10520 [Candidatus Firestonebacteria bacterium]